MGDKRNKKAGRLRSLWRLPGSGKRRRMSVSQREGIKQTYERFKEILALNDSTLQLISDIEDRV